MFWIGLSHIDVQQRCYLLYVRTKYDNNAVQSGEISPTNN
jgi:hypothetical protein